MAEIGAYIDKTITIITGLIILLYFIPKRKKEIDGLDDIDKVAKINKQNKFLKIAGYILILIGIVQIILFR